MKRILLAAAALLPLLAACSKHGDPLPKDVCATINDQNFKNYCYANFDRDRDGVVSKEEAELVTSLRINDRSITSVDGISAFSKIESIDVSGSSITSLDLSRNPELTSVMANTCTYLGSINFGSISKIQSVTITNTKITALNVSNMAELVNLDCSSNSITALDVTKCTKLMVLDCSMNSIASLDLSKNTAIKKIECFMPTLKEITITTDLYTSFTEFFKELKAQLPDLKMIML